MAEPMKIRATLQVDTADVRILMMYPMETGERKDAEGASGQPVWEVVTAYLRNKKVIRPPKLNLPRLTGSRGNPGIS